MAMRMMALMVIVAGSTACAGDKPKPPVAVADSGPPQWAGYVQRSIAAAIGDSTSRIEGITASGGNLYVADWKDGGIYRLSPVANSPAPLAEVERVGQLPTKPGTTIFGVAADKSGNLYFAIPEAGIVYRADGARPERTSAATMITQNTASVIKALEIEVTTMIHEGNFAFETRYPFACNDIKPTAVPDAKKSHRNKPTIRFIR